MESCDFGTSSKCGRWGETWVEQDGLWLVLSEVGLGVQLSLRLPAFWEQKGDAYYLS